MRKEILLGIAVIALTVVAMSGCSSTGMKVKQLTVKGYIEDKQRVDQLKDGNQGYLMGTAPETPPGKPTRKVFVVEMTKEVPLTAEEQNALKDIEPGKSTTTTVTTESASSPSQSLPTYPGSNISIPSFDEPAAQTPTEGSAPSVSMPAAGTEYTVEKDDTLQKISKKFYGNYSKWMKIYEVNKDRIKNPDRIKPGTKIIIPAFEVPAENLK